MNIGKCLQGEGGCRREGGRKGKVEVWGEEREGWKEGKETKICQSWMKVTVKAAVKECENMCTCMCAHICICVCVCVHIYVFVYVYVCTYIYLCMCMCAHICMYHVYD